MDEVALMEQALTAARRAADLVLTGYRTLPATSTKSSRVDLVTDYDLRSERLIRESLAKTGLPIVGEEEGGEPAPGPTWYIDPIDGTTNFAHGHPMFCVSIGLLDRGIPVLGAVVAPALHVAWQGCRAAGAYRNGHPCRVSDTAELEQALLSTGFAPGARAQAQRDRSVAWFGRVLPLVRGVRRDGSAALDLCMTADGTFSGYWELGLNPWDVVGGAAIALSAGATITDPAGGVPDYDAGDLLATNGRIHRALLQVLR